MVAKNASLSFTLPEGVRLVEVFGRQTNQIDNTVTVALPDFSARQVERVVVALVASPGARNGTVDIAGVHLSYTDVLTEKAEDAQLSLAAMVTEDSTLALRNRDKKATSAASSKGA